jgi:hypothetical protein
VSKREIRVRPVVRYIITDYAEEARRPNGPARGSITLGEYPSASDANTVAAAVHLAARALGAPQATLHPAPQLTVVQNGSRYDLEVV